MSIYDLTIHFLCMSTKTNTNQYVRFGDSFHGKTIESALAPLDSALNAGHITPADHTLIRNYITQKQVLSGITVLRMAKIVYTLISWRRFIKPFNEVDFADLTMGLSKLQSADSARGEKFSQETIADFIRIFKTFYTWMSDEGLTARITPAQMKKIKTPEPSRSRYSDSDVLTTAQIETLLNRCWDLEIKTMFALLYEGALRIGELGTLKWNQVEFYRDHTNLIVRFKTKYTRQIPIILYHQYISMWRNSHTPDPDEYVFTNRFGEPYQYGALVKRLNRLQGLSPNVSEQALWRNRGDDLKPIPFRMHLIRHSRITHMIQSGMPKEVVSMICWGRLNAGELDRYAHVFNSTDTMALRFYGITPTEKKPAGILKPEVCKSCGYLNSPGSMFCSSCNSPLTDEAREQFNTISAGLDMETLKRFIIREIENRG